jgi:predicted amidohydrolase
METFMMLLRFFIEAGGSCTEFMTPFLLFSPSFSVRSLADYRKVNLASGESTVFTPGEMFSPVVELEPGVRVGLLICFDIFLPEPARILALGHANLMLVPTANGYPADYNPLARVIVPSRAIENNAVVCYVNWVQSGPLFGPFVSFHGQTSVADNGANILFMGTPDTQQVEHIHVNLTNYVGSTAIGRPAPDYIGFPDSGLCANISNEVDART